VTFHSSRHMDSGSAESPTGTGRHQWFSVRSFCDWLGRGQSRKRRTRGRLRPKSEMDNFSYSHRCTSSVRLRSGARSVFKHRRVPLI